MGVDERYQRVESASAEFDRPAIGKQLAAIPQDLETTELDYR
jgi:hypothetical protein